MVFYSDSHWGISIIDSPYFILSSNYFCLSAWRGAYVVSKENLGMNPGLIAGGSLLVDYILTVAVSVSAGTDAITSAFPSLHAHNVIIAVIFVILITILNLRGVTESASVLAYPVYLFVLALFILIGVGIYNILTGQVSPTLHTPIGTPVAGISLFLLLRAFASGSSALTGVEAISNAIRTLRILGQTMLQKHCLQWVHYLLCYFQELYF